MDFSIGVISKRILLTRIDFYIANGLLINIGSFTTLQSSRQRTYAVNGIVNRQSGRMRMIVSALHILWLAWRWNGSTVCLTMKQRLSCWKS